MRQPDTKHLLSLLVKTYNQTITDYFYFPEIIYAGNQKIERCDFERLLSEELLVLFKYDSFGRYYQLSKKGKTTLYRQLAAKQHRKKTVLMPLTQGCLYFNRLKTPNATGARCLLFL